MTTPLKPGREDLAERIEALRDQLQGMAEQLAALQTEVLGGEGAGGVEAVGGETVGPSTEGPARESAEKEAAEEISEEAAAAALEEDSGGSVEFAEGPPEEAGEAVDEEEASELPLAAAALTAAAEPDLRAREERAARLESKIGTVWLNRLGLFSLVVGFAFLARLVAPRMLPWHRVLVAYIGSGFLFGLGWYLDARLRQFSRPVMAGGLALGFFTSFAAYFLEPMACLPLWASLLLMIAFVGGVFYCAEKWKSESTAGFALFLGHVAAYVASVNTDNFSMVAVLFLSLTGLALLARHNWVGLALFSVVAAFSSHFLWALRESELVTRPDRFGLNLAFLTAYYLIFLAADVLFFSRLSRHGAEAFDRQQRVAGRNIGPTAMVLYASLAAALFSTTGHWHQIHLFLFPMVAVQLAVLLIHRRLGTADTPLYLAAATTFGTLGLFSLLGGLALNMALAAEALLLLILGRAIDFWFLRPLAQGVLAVNFVHFWLSDARQLDSWPAFAGAVLMASIYFVKARLNETWKPVPDDQRMSKAGPWSVVWRKFFERISNPVAHVQTLAGGILMTYQCQKFLGPPVDGFFLAGVAVLAAGASLTLRSSPLLQGGLWIQAGAMYLLCRQAAGSFVAESPWAINQGAAFLLAAIPAAGLALARRQRMRRLLRFGSLGLALASVAGFAAAVAGPTPWDLGQRPFSWLALLCPLTLWLALELWPRPREEEAGALGEKETRFLRMGRWRRIFFAVLAAGIGFWASLEATAHTPTALLVLSGLTVLLGLAAFWRGGPYLLVGLFTHQLLLTGGSLWFLQAGDPAHAHVRWWLLTETVAMASLLLLACPRFRRGSYALGGLAALVLALAYFGWLTLLPDQHFSPVLLWCLPVAGLFAALEIFRSSPARCHITLPLWPDRRGEKLFLGYSQGLAGLVAIFTSTALGLMLGRALPSQEQALWAMMAAAGVLLAAAVLRSSPYLMAGLLTLLGLMTFHRMFYGDQLVAEPILEWASVTVLMASAAVLLWAAPRHRRSSFAWGGVLTLTLGLVALAELLFNERPGPSPSIVWILTFGAGWWAVEELWRGFWRRSAEAGSWRDEVDLEHLSQRSLSMAMAFSVVLAFLLVVLTWRLFPLPATMITVTILYAVLFVAVTAALKSPPMAAGIAVCLTAAHPLLYGRIGASSAADVYPLLALLLLVVTLAAGMAAEWIFQHLDEPGRRRPAWWGAWYPYFLGFLLALLFLGPYGVVLFGHEAMAAPTRLALGVACFAVARGLRLRWLVRAALGYALIVSGLLVAGAALFASMRSSLLLSSLLVAVELVVMEAILAGQDPMVLSRKSPKVVHLQRRTLVLAAAATATVGCWLSVEMRGFWTAAGWGLVALAFMGLGFLRNSRLYRRTALALFALALLRLFLFDVTRLDILYSMLAMLSLGACLVAGSFLYNRYRERIDRWL